MSNNANPVWSGKDPYSGFNLNPTVVGPSKKAGIVALSLFFVNIVLFAIMGTLIVWLSELFNNPSNLTSEDSLHVVLYFALVFLIVGVGIVGTIFSIIAIRRREGYSLGIISLILGLAFHLFPAGFLLLSVLAIFAGF